MTEQKVDFTLTVTDEFSGMRLDRYLAHHYPTATFGMVQKLCRKGAIRIDGKRVKGNERLELGQMVKVAPVLFHTDKETQPKNDRPRTLSVQDKKEIESWTLYEDDEFLIVNKPYDLPTQAGTGHEKSLDRLLRTYAGGGEFAPRLVHRLDKTTTGCMVFAKGRQIASFLTGLFKKHEIQKVYLALVHGSLKPKKGTFNYKIAKSVGDFEKMAETSKGKEAITDYEVLKSKGNYHLVQLSPRTGRTHQIRVHLSIAGAPIVGDEKYDGLLNPQEGIPKKKIYLHSASLHWQEGRKKFGFRAPLPEHFVEALNHLGWDVDAL